MGTPLQDEANRRNGRLSRGRKTPGGKAVSAKNALKHGLLSREVLLPDEDNGVNSFDYLTELLRHAEELKQNPPEWMPWNYRQTLARLSTPAAA